MRIGIKNFGIISPYGFSSQVWNKILNHELDKNIVSVDGINICCLDIPTNEDKIDKKILRRMDKQVIYLLKSVIEAIREAGIEIEKFSSDEKQRIGFFGGSMFAQIEFGHEQVKRLIKCQGKNKNISMFTGLSFYYGAPTVEASILYKTKGENCTITSGSNSGTDCVIAATDNIKREENDIVFTIAGENINTPIATKMLLHQSDKKWNMIDSSKYHYSSGAICAIISKITEQDNCPIEIIASKSYNAEDCLFSFNDSFVKVIEKVICDCLDEVGLSTSDIDLILPSFNNVSNGDFFEVEALSKLFGGLKSKVYIPEIIIGDMLSASGLLKLFIAYKCMNHNVIPSNKCGFRKTSTIDSLISKQTQSCKVKYALILQKSFIGGKVSAIILKNNITRT